MNFFNQRIVFLLSILALVCVPRGWSQGKVDRSIMPTAGPAPEIQLAEPASFTLDNGLQVFVVENNKLPKVAFSLIIDRKPIVEGENAGFLELTGEVLGTATESLSKQEIDEQIDFIGATLSTSSSSVYAACLTKHVETLMTIMSDVILRPVFKEEELEKSRKQVISGLEASKESPDAIVSRIGDLIIYGEDHPYGEISTIESVEKVNIEDIKTYYDTYFKPNKAYLAIVGDITVDKAKELTNKYLGKWEQGTIPDATYEAPEVPESTLVHMINRSNAVQSVINIVNTFEMKPGSEDVIAANVMNNLLGGGATGRLFQNLREDKAYTYGAYSSVDSDPLVGEFRATASVRNEVTDSSLTEFMKEFEKIKEEKVSEEDVANTIASLTGTFARSLENPQTIARFAINLARYDMPSTYYQDYLKNLAAITPEKVQEMAKKYVHPDKAHIVIVGKASEIGASLEQFGKVMYYDNEGKPYDPAAAAVPQGVDANSVISKYIETIGGEENISAVKDITKVMGGEMMGNALTLTQKLKTPNLSYNKMDAGIMVQELFVNGEEAFAKSTMGNQKLEGKQLATAILQSRFIPELYYEELGFAPKLTGTENVNGEPAYVVEVHDNEGLVYTNYYGQESGLKLRTVVPLETPQGSFTQINNFSDYQTYEGVKIPAKLVQSFGPQSLDLSVKEIKINSGLSEDEFSIPE